MRTKTVLLSALLGALGSISVSAQNVYSLNAVGYVNCTVYPGWNIITCPLNCTPDNTLNTVMNNGAGSQNGAGSLDGCLAYFYVPSILNFSSDSAKAIGSGPTKTLNTNGWSKNGTNVLGPGVGCWFFNSQANPITLTFVGQVPSGITNTLTTGFNLVGSAVPMSGDLCSNVLSTLTNFNIGDQIYTYNNAVTNFSTFATSPNHLVGKYGYGGHWTSAGDPTTTNVAQGFWYFNASSPVTNVVWTESYSVSQ